MVLAARARRSRGPRVPRSRERVHATRLAHLGPLRSELFDEIVGRVQETDTSAPIRRGAYEYFSRTIEGQQYGVHCRRPAGGDALPDPLAAPGIHSGRDGDPRRERARAGPRLLRGRRPRRSAPTRPSPPTAPTPTAVSATSCAFRSCATPAGSTLAGEPAVELDDVVPDVLRRRLGQRQRHRALHPSRRRHAPVADLAAHARHARRRRRARVPGGRRPLLRRRGPHPQRSLHRDLVGLEGDERGVAGRRRRAHRRPTDRRAARAGPRVPRRAPRRRGR